MSDDGHLTLPKTPSDTDSNSNSNSGSLFSRCYPDELSSSNSSGSKENTPSLSNNENSSSPKLLSHRAEPVPTVRQRLLKNLFSEGIKCQPKITHNDSIDLATAEEKSNSDDEWFIQRINPKSKTHFIDWSGKCGNYLSLGTTHADVQKFLMKQLVELRRRGQQKRRALYNADNGIVLDRSGACKRTNEERKASEWNFSEQSQENKEVVKEKVEKLKCDLIEHEAAESYNDDNETVSDTWREINGEKTNIEDKYNKVEEEVAKENDNIELSKDRNRNGNTSDEDWRKDWLQSGMKTYKNLTKLKNHASYLSDNETDSSNLSGETTDSEEGNRSSPSLVDELLSDIAANCSGIFDYPEDNSPEEYNKISIDGNGGGDDRDDEDEGELVRQNRKPRKRRLVFSSDESDEDEEGKCGGSALKSVKNVQDLQAANGERTEACCTSDHKKEHSCDGINAVLNENDNFEVNDKDNFLFADKSNGHKRGVTWPIDKTMDEDQRIERMEGTDSSDDELEVFHKLQIAQGRKKRSEYIEEEASLSGDDVGSDENDDEDQLNVYEAEEGDNDELPDDETIREQLNKQWLKQQQDEEDRKLLYWKDQLLVDGELADETDRTFRFKLRLEKSEDADKEIEEVTIDTENIEVNEDELCKRRREISKWKIKEGEAKLHGESSSIKGTNSLLKAASKVIEKGSLDGNSQSYSRVDDSLCKNSLMHHRKSLSQVLNQTKITSYTKSAGLVSANGHIEKQKDTRHSTQDVVAKSRSMKVRQCSRKLPQ
ncbi:conserved hypothetical protein [Brugia malayi]|uniref:Bm3591, isoform b n=1 Tax=Brugia malayi TaxID=6279 RepID=A0A0J9XRG2_BRUMA|nr:uncharacterized protein BM_BM3591 [Brugia malayi]CDP93747.1 Bm3591, isoform b [Brugia malayi]VIO99810.1 conserved hypothetical protein [Brugia malayi]